ncbi:MAG: type IV toxin-antitoxin system AbiEi family antitoxin, partial [Thermoflexibacter sp.]|nr:type IV toxin-antitoxin system AbiEi family antitoxin [Thermoflexibacter sp.]
AVTGIATGSLSEIFKSLKENKFLIESGKEGKVLVNRKKLLEKFIIGYNEYLRPKLNGKKYRFLEATILKNWGVIDFQNKDIFWAGEPAAALQTNYLKPEKWSIYSRIERKELIKILKIVPDENGNLEIRNGFWTSKLQEAFIQQQVVPPLLSYLDLILSEESRNVETAQIIYEKYLSDFFEKY